MKKKLSVLLAVALVFSMLPVSASADTGPKPSVTVEIVGISGEEAYGTLLTEQESTGPYSVAGLYAGTWQSAWDDADETGRKFLEYDCPEGLNYLQFYDDCSDGELYWGYYPPQKFKLLLYFPESGEFVLSNADERYAFKSTYICTVTDSAAVLDRQYDYVGMTVGGAVRFLLTLIIEIGLALAFGFREKRQLWLLLAVNLATQLGLNFALALTVYRYGGWAETAVYALLEIVIFAVEAAIYAAFMKRPENNGAPKKCHPILYAFTANAASFAAGLALADLFPEIF